MVFNTISVGTAVAPTVIQTYFSHYLNRKSLRQKPTAHISYHEGLHLIRQFLHHASLHSVEDIQDFTSQWVPYPSWVKVDEVCIPLESITESARLLVAQLGEDGVNRVGGKRWWQWRREGSVLKAEWIEMRSQYTKRKRSGEKCKRVMLYVHGGGYFFGSVARYRLAPQFPFPCGLHDCLSAYLYLLNTQDPSTIILAGDSAGGGMILSILVILRDRGIPLPAGAILISPWVDLTHSFPSLAGDGALDFIPAHGFLHRPSISWPPPNAEDVEQMAKQLLTKLTKEIKPKSSPGEVSGESVSKATLDFPKDQRQEVLLPSVSVANPIEFPHDETKSASARPGPGHYLSITVEGETIDIKDQIQIYTTNQLISHPLVSPVLQPSLGGLPPLLILTGGGELLRDEQIYVAHKAANPSRYPPGEDYIKKHPEVLEVITKWRPTDVQLQVWDDLCHVAPTLSFTRPAKYMYRSIAQFGAWALARAQKTEIEIQDDDDVSIISSASDAASNQPLEQKSISLNGNAAPSSQHPAKDQIGKEGGALPPFRNHMIRQRVDMHGNIYPLEPVSLLPGLQVPANEIGVIKPGPVLKWREAQTRWNSKFAKEKRKIQTQRAKDMIRGFERFGDDEIPPPSALAGRRCRNIPIKPEGKKPRNWGMSLWSLWGSSYDEKMIDRDVKADTEGETGKQHDTVGTTSPTNTSQPQARRLTVSDEGQTEPDSFSKTSKKET